MCWKIIAIITENARNNTHKKKVAYIVTTGLLIVTLSSRVL
jgi:hypothetical protein